MELSEEATALFERAERAIDQAKRLRDGCATMAIKSLLADTDLTPEQCHIIELAFSDTLRQLDLVDRERDDPICALVAQKMMAIHKRGVTDAVSLTEVTIREIYLPRS